MSETERRLVVKRKYLNIIKQTLNKPAIDQTELYSLIRNFFSEFLKLNYQFTYEELSQELNKIFIKQDLKEELDAFIVELSESEYFYEKELEQEEIKKILKKLNKYVDAIIIENILQKEEKQNLFQKLFKKKEIRKINESPKIIIEKKEIIPEIIPPEENFVEKENINEQQNKLIEQLNTQLQKQTNAIIESQNFENEKTELKIKNISQIKEKKIIVPQQEKTKIETSNNEIKPYNSEERKNTQSLLKQNPITLEDNRPEIVKIYELIEEAYIHLNNKNKNKSKQIYEQALNYYHNLLIDEKKEIYQVLYELYLKLK